jgi:hypothetical protein
VHVTIWQPRQDPKETIMNTCSRRRDLPEEIVDMSEQRQTSSVLDELIEQRLRMIMDQNELQIQQVKRFKQMISQYEERIGKIEEKQPEIDSIAAKCKQRYCCFG